MSGVLRRNDSRRRQLLTYSVNNAALLLASRGEASILVILGRGLRGIRAYVGHEGHLLDKLAPPLSTGRVTEIQLLFGLYAIRIEELTSHA